MHIAFIPRVRTEKNEGPARDDNGFFRVLLLLLLLLPLLSLLLLAQPLLEDFLPQLQQKKRM
jgi:hypothetical protein